MVWGHSDCQILPARALDALTEPVLRPIRRFIPTLGGLDISPVILLLALSFIEDLIRSNAYRLAG